MKYFFYDNNKIITVFLIIFIPLSLLFSTNKESLKFSTKIKFLYEKNKFEQLVFYYSQERAKNKNKTFSQSTLFRLADAYLHLKQSEKSVELFYKLYRKHKNKKVNKQILKKIIYLLNDPENKTFKTLTQNLYFPKLLKEARKRLLYLPTEKDEKKLLIKIFLLREKNDFLIPLLLKNREIVFEKDYLNKIILLLYKKKSTKQIDYYLAYLKKNNYKYYVQVFGNFLWKNGRYKKALVLYENAFNKLYDISYLIKKGKIFLEMNRMKEAFKCWNRYLDYYSYSYAAYYGLTEIYIDNGYYEEALKLIKKAEKKSLHLYSLHFRILLILKRYKQAVDLYIKLYLEKKIHFYNFKNAMNSLKKEVPALSVLYAKMKKIVNSKNSKIKKDIQFLQFYNSLLLEYGKYNEAVNLALNISRLKKDKGLYLLNLSNHLIKDSLIQAAQYALSLYSNTYLQKGISDFKESYSFTKMKLEYHKKNYHAALELLNEIKKIKKRKLNIREIYLWKGINYFQLGKIKKALEYFIASGQKGQSGALSCSLSMGSTTLTEKMLHKYNGSLKNFFSAMLALQKKEYKNALSFFYKAALEKSINPENSAALYYIYLLENIKPTKLAKKFFRTLSLSYFSQKTLSEHYWNSLLSEIEKKEGKNLLWEFTLYQSIVYDLKNNRIKQCIKKLTVLEKEGKNFELKNHSIYLLSKLQKKNYIEYLKKYSHSPYSFFTREALRKRVN